jgi:drug/metabolite transporter (DMT)-like permease
MTGNIALSAVFVFATAFANVMQKKAIAAIGPHSVLSLEFVRGLALSPYMWCGMLAYVLALAMYVVLLTRVPLNVATSIAALNFVAVLLAARFVLGEPIPPLRYVGFLCIVIGIYLVALTQRVTR